VKYSEKLSAAISKTGSHVIVGLDTDVNKIPFFLEDTANPITEFNNLIIESTKDVAAGYKLNTAFYEQAGDLGLFALKQTMINMPAESITICDAKRGDIGNTDEMYAAAYLDNYKFDSITVNPYLGHDAVEPFLKRANKLSYILILTSNPGSKDFQLLKVGTKYMYEMVIDKCMEWNTNENTGFVVGANYTAEIKKITSEYKHIPLLIPGVGAQAYELKPLVENLNNRLFVINSSRGIIYAAPREASKEEYMEKVRAAALKLRDEINSLLKI
jgi:orotidine-5'-phosphate decarboxylase